MLLLMVLGVAAGMVIPFQTSINSRLGAYTHSSFYASTISFFVGSLCLIIINACINPHMLTPSYLLNQDFNFYWFTGGLLGVIFLTGNLLLLPRLGASLTVVMSVSGQIIMGVIIDTFGWFGASTEPFTFLKFIGILCLILGILLMNYVRNRTHQHSRPLSFYIWLTIGFVFGFCPPLQTTINSTLGQQVHSSFLASLISFATGTLALFILTLIFHRSLKVHKQHAQHGRLRPFYFIGGFLGMIFVTMNIILMPHLGAAVTTIVGMLGQMLMGVIIDQFGLLGTPRNTITVRKVLGLIAIMIGIILLRLF